MCRRQTQPYEVPALPPVIVPHASSCSRDLLVALADDAASHREALWSLLALPEHAAAIFALTGQLAREVAELRMQLVAERFDRASLRSVPDADDRFDRSDDEPLDLGLDDETVCLFGAQAVG